MPLGKNSIVENRLFSLSFLRPLILMILLGVLFFPSLLEPLLQVLFPNAGEWVFVRRPLWILAAEHLGLSVAAAVPAALIGVFLGVFVTRPQGRAFAPVVRDAAALAQTIPPAAVLALAIPFLGFGTEPVLVALILYSVLPVLNNTLVGLENLPAPVLESGRGMGMKPRQLLFQVELPLALPLIGTGIRTSVVINVGTATLGALAGAGGLGSPIVAGLVRDNPAWVFQGAAVSALLALTLNSLLKELEMKVSSPGLSTSDKDYQ